jgi:hypothetical protein
MAGSFLDSETDSAALRRSGRGHQETRGIGLGRSRKVATDPDGPHREDNHCERGKQEQERQDHGILLR